MEESGRVPGGGRLYATIEKLSGRVSEKGRISVRTEKMLKSGRVPGKGKIRTTNEKLSRRVLENGRISVSTRNW